MGVKCCFQQTREIKTKSKPRPQKLNTNLKFDGCELYSDSLYFKPRQKSYYQKQLMLESLQLNPVCPNSYEVLELIGKGSYGHVLCGKCTESDELIAIKEIPLVNLKETNLIIEEVKILSELNHHNIVRYLGSKVTDEFCYIFMEFVSGGTIDSLLMKHGPFAESLIKMYTFQVLKGLEYLHMHEIVHRDIKGTNILVSGDGLCKLADFGSAKKILGFESTCSVTGTINWMAPEVIRESGHGRFADIWSLGCLVVEMATGQQPWAELKNQLEVIDIVLKTDIIPKIPDNFSADLKDFLKSCFVRRPNLRKNVGELLESRFIKDSNCPELYTSENHKNVSTRYVSD